MTAAASRAGNADALVIFGISGDLARVMTFRSLYRLERRGLLDCPIHGVAVDDWSVEDLRDHARAAIVATGEALDEAVYTRKGVVKGLQTGQRRACSCASLSL